MQGLKEREVCCISNSKIKHKAPEWKADAYTLVPYFNISISYGLKMYLPYSFPLYLPLLDHPNCPDTVRQPSF